MSTIDPSEVDAAELARNMSQATDAQLAELMAGPLRDEILDEVFRRMADHFRADRAGDTDAVIHWRITGREDDAHDVFETVIAGGACEARRGTTRDDSRVTFTISGAHFLRLVTGNAAGPMLFMRGKLKIDGDVLFAASAASLFEIPSA